MKYALLNKHSIKHKLKSRKSDYCADLQGLLEQCELNYQLFNALLTDFVTAADKNCLNVMKIPHQQFKCDKLRLSLKVTDVARYTTTLSLTIQPPGIKKIQQTRLIVRLYHDAKMAEVMEGSGPSAIKAVPDKTEIGVKAVDEKQQINRFLGECLRACLKLQQH